MYKGPKSQFYVEEAIGAIPFVVGQSIPVNKLTLTMKAFAWDPLSWLVVGANRPFDLWKHLTFPLNLQKAESVARGEDQLVYLSFGVDFRICEFPSFCLLSSRGMDILFKGSGCHLLYSQC